MFKTLALLLFLVAPTHAVEQADVIVYGSTPGGFCAAIAAAREGASVILLEPTDHVGGVNTGGLSFSDSNQTVRSTVMGLFHEWHTRIEKDYQSRGIKLPYSVSVKDQAKWSYEPHVAMRVTMQMLEEAKVRVLKEYLLESVVKDGARITLLKTNKGDFAAKVFIDATYEGDLMAAAKVSWTIGREGRNEYDESLAGRQYPKAKMKMSGFDDQGKLLPLITTEDGGPDADGDDRVMTYSFRLSLTDNPDNRVPFPKPAHYDPARFEAVRRHLASGGRGVGFDLYDVPNRKLDGNNSIGGQFSLGLVGACNGWSQANAQQRAAIWEAHKQYTLEFYHFLTTDPAVPAATRAKFASLGLCKDEFVEHGHWPPQLYVREGRRMKGLYVVSQKDIIDSPSKEDPIVVSSFPIDSHDVQRIAFKDGTVVNEGTIFPVRMKGKGHGYPYHIPYRAILPRPQECNNLLVPVALSCTHVAISSIRVEPTWMILGQSAGIAGALAAKKDLAVQDLPYDALRERLLAQNQVLKLPSLLDERTTIAPDAIDPAKLRGIVLDDAKAELAGNWSRSTNFKPFVGVGYVHDDKRADGKSIATFRLKVPKSGRYDLLMAYSAHETRATRVPITIRTGKQTIKITVDQTKALPKGQSFRKVATVELSSEGETTITLSNQRTDGFVILDAIQFVEAAK